MVRASASVLTDRARPPLMPAAGFEEQFTQVAAELKLPAGPAPEFASLKSIKANHEAFVVACHKTWKKWHEKAIHEILVFEGFMDRERKTRALGPVAVEWAEYNQALWRKVNDSIIWTLVGQQRHVVKRLCLYHQRPTLGESNADTILSLLHKVNSDPRSIAIWNDATSCVDIGDITYVKDGLVPTPVFWEVKEGVVNDEIVELLKEKGAKVAEKMQAFHDRRGQKGILQLERFIRQETTAQTALTLLNEEKGTDPITGLHMQVLTVNSELASWDEILRLALTEALSTMKPAVVSVDGCLWIYADANPELSREHVAANFGRWLSEHVPGVEESFKKRWPSWDADHVVCLNTAFWPPLARPIFLRNLSAALIGAVIHGALRFRVFLYIDWDAFGRLVHAEGGRFSWSSEKAARRARAMKPNLRPVIARGQIPQIHVDPATFQVTDPMLVQMLFDGLTPRSVIKQTLDTPLAEIETVTIS